MSLCKCDNCGQYFPENEIENHKLFCIFSLQQKELENLIPCEICNQLIDFNVYHQHLLRCNPVPVFTQSNFPSLSTNSNFDIPTLPPNNNPVDNISSFIERIDNILHRLRNIDNSYDNLINLDENNVSVGIKKIEDFITRKQEKITCPICTIECEDIGETICGHKFCYECIEEWLKDNKKCPVCMIEFNEN